MKKFIIAANWKLNGNNTFISNFIYKLKQYFNNHNIINKIIFIPPVIYINNINNKIKNKNFFLGAQNVDLNFYGAYTGEISVNMLKDIGVTHVIIGHSERRKFHNESNSLIAKKFKILKDNHIVPILCMGENIEEKKLNKTHEICQRQIEEILNISGRNAFHNSIIAYEPIWAIGTGKTAPASYAQKIHSFIKKYISENSNINYEDIIVQYGGSINENNVEQFIAQKDINGVLLGNASLVYETFIKIIKKVNNI